MCGNTLSRSSSSASGGIHSDYGSTVLSKMEASSSASGDKRSSKNYPQKNDRQITLSRGNDFLSAALRAPELKSASQLAEGYADTEKIPDGIVDDVADLLLKLDAFNRVDVSKTDGFREVVRTKLEEFAETRVEAIRRRENVNDWFLRCLTNWLRNFWDPYSEEPLRWGDAAHLDEVKEL